MKSRLLWELGLVTLALVLVTHILYVLRFVPWIDASLSTIVALLFLYVPVLVLWKRRREIDFLDRTFPGYARSLAVYAVTAVILFPPYAVLAHLWQVIVVHFGSFHMRTFPSAFRIGMFQLVMVALPEEFYFRGYVQSTLNHVFEKRWSLFGTRLGWGWVITAIVFACAHSLVTYRWWHFSIFFPALLFGFLRERTGTITAPIFFHATSNLFMEWFANCYL